MRVDHLIIGGGIAGTTAAEEIRARDAQATILVLGDERDLTYSRVMLPHVVRFNARSPQVRRAYAELASAPELAAARDGVERACDALVARLESLLNLAGMPRSLADCGVDRNQIKTLAAEAAKQWTATFNPRDISEADFVGLYEAAFERRGDGDGLKH